MAITKLARVVIKGDSAPALGSSPPEPVYSLLSNTMGEHSTFIPRLCPPRELGISRMLG